MQLLFVTIAGVDVGFGHLRRCISLAEYARLQEIKVSFLLFGDLTGKQEVERAGFACMLQPYEALAGEAVVLEQGEIKAFDAAVVDLAHPVVFRDIAGSQRLFLALQAHSRAVIVIDALGEQALAPRMPGMPADVLVTPYVGVVDKVDSPWQTLAGPEYAILAPAYLNLPKRVVREQADRVLVSCGGSDPKSLTSLVMQGLELIPSKLTVRVISGPLFSQYLVGELEVYAAGMRHMIELIHAPESLTEHMLWCDLAIAASGLIKYELAATSTPAVLLSIDHSHDVVNRPFAKMGTARDLGIDFSAQSVANATLELLGNRKVRSAMAESGRRLVDGKGVERLIEEIVRCCCAEK